jgi:iron-binding CDGSH zinc finger protein
MMVPGVRTNPRTQSPGRGHPTIIIFLLLLYGGSMTDAQHGNPEEKKPSVEVSENGPYIAHNITRLRNSKGVHIETTSTVILCHCGHSKNKPFCDGSHYYEKFEDEKN